LDNFKVGDDMTKTKTYEERRQGAYAVVTALLTDLADSGKGIHPAEMKGIVEAVSDIIGFRHTLGQVVNYAINNDKGEEVVSLLDQAHSEACSYK